MNSSIPIIDEFNTVTGAAVAVVSYIFGANWFLFAAFLALNVADWLTGWIKSYMNHRESSYKGLTGILKKVGYWIMIAVSFSMSEVFIAIGKTINIDLGVTRLLGWFVLASLLMNEIRSILENFVEAGFDVPDILVQGLEVAEKVVEAKEKAEKGLDGVLYIDSSDPEKDLYRLTLDVPLEELEKREEIVLKINPHAILNSVQGDEEDG